jgi:hypothetical protein
MLRKKVEINENIFNMPSLKASSLLKSNILILLQLNAFLT